MNRVSTEVLSIRYSRGTSIAAVLIAASWHGFNDGPAMLGSWSGYRWPVAVLVAWVLFSAIAAVNSVEILRDGIVRHPWFTIGAALTISASVAVASHGAVTTAANWGWGAIGWLGVLAAWGRSLAPLFVLSVVNTVLNGAVLFAVGMPSRLALALLLMSGSGAIALQLGFIVGARALSAAAEWAVKAAAARSETEARRLAGEQAHAARQRRYELLQRTAARALDGLATGVSDPTDPDVQRQCAIEAARLRRLFLETEDVPDPLLHEVRAGVDMAERRGVLVDLRTVGTLPNVPVEVRRAMVEPLIVVLAAAAGKARVTLAAMAEEVTVSVVARTSIDVVIPLPYEPIQLQHHQEGGALWVQIRWSDPSPSPSLRTTTSSSRASSPGLTATRSTA
jgi:hypothetical protein